LNKPLENFLWHCVLIAGIHVGSIHYGKAKTARVDATFGNDFQDHFKGHKNPFSSIKPKFHYTDFHRNFPAGKVVDANHESCGHKR